MLNIDSCPVFLVLISPQDGFLILEVGTQVKDGFFVPPGDRNIVILHFTYLEDFIDPIRVCILGFLLGQIIHQHSAEIPEPV